MATLRWLLVVFEMLTYAFGKHVPMKYEKKWKAYPRQMIIPNKFIPMLKESALFRSRSSSNDLSEFLKPNQHEDVTGKTRQSLMNAMGMDTGGSQEEGGISDGGMSQGGMGPAAEIRPGEMEPGEMGPVEMGPGGMGPGGMGPDGGRNMEEMAALGGNEGTGSEGQLRGEGALEGFAKSAAGMGAPGEMSNQMNGIGGMAGGMFNPGGGESPLKGLMGGNHEMNPMNNAGPEGMMSDSNQLPAGDPMGTLKSMLDNQGTNAALGTSSEAFGPGGSTNANVLAMLNQIVGKEMPGESPVDPSSRSEQMWDQLQKGFSNQRQAVQPYIESNSDTKAPPTPPQKETPSNNASPSKPTTSFSVTVPAKAGLSNQTNATPVYNLTGLSKTSAFNKNFPQPNQPVENTEESAAGHTTDTQETKITGSNLKTAKANIKTKEESRENMNAKPPSTPGADINLDDNQPISDDMVKFLKGIKFVVSQEPGNDIILGKKFTSDVLPTATSFKEENGVMKNVVSEKNRKADEREGKHFLYLENNNESVAIENDLKNLDLSYARNLLLRRHVKDEDLADYRKALKVLGRASRKLDDPIAKKSTEIAIASILKVLVLEKAKNATSVPKNYLLAGGDAKNALSEKYFEAARVLGTASKKLADPVAKKSAEIGIASILKVIALGHYSLSKKSFVPFSHYKHDAARMFFTKYGLKRTEKSLAATEIARKLTAASNMENNV